ncbi:MAG: hypothetical protein ACM336_16795 [Acidobacteriota bacterium]
MAAFLIFGLVTGLSAQGSSCPTSPLQGVDATVTLQTSFEQGTGLYTYTYTVQNTGKKDLERFMVTVSPPIASQSQPTGWAGALLLRDASKDPNEYSWEAYAIVLGTPDDGMIPPLANPLRPGDTMTFSFRSPLAPGPAAYWIAGDLKVDNVFLPPIPPGATDDEIYAAHEEAAETMAELCPDLGGDLYTMSRLTAGQAPTTFTGVTVDVSPGIPAPNPVSPKTSGPVYVAVLGTATFDASTVDPASARLGRNSGHAIAYIVDDVNGDSRPDMYLLFQMQDTGTGCFDKAVFLEAATTTGSRVRGSDLIAPSCP